MQIERERAAIAFSPRLEFSRDRDASRRRGRQAAGSRPPRAQPRARAHSPRSCCRIAIDRRFRFHAGQMFPVLCRSKYQPHTHFDRPIAQRQLLHAISGHALCSGLLSPLAPAVPIERSQRRSQDRPRSPRSRPQPPPAARACSLDHLASRSPTQPIGALWQSSDRRRRPSESSAAEFPLPQQQLNQQQLAPQAASGSTTSGEWTRMRMGDRGLINSARCPPVVAAFNLFFSWLPLSAVALGLVPSRRDRVTPAAGTQEGTAKRHEVARSHRPCGEHRGKPRGERRGTAPPSPHPHDRSPSHAAAWSGETSMLTVCHAPSLL